MGSGGDGVGPFPGWVCEMGGDRNKPLQGRMGCGRSVSCVAVVGITLSVSVIN